MTTGVPALDRALATLMKLDNASVLALLDIAEERVRQIEKKGWTPEHDDAHKPGEMARAAACYADPPAVRPGSAAALVAPTRWPWDSKWWKPGAPHCNRVKAGALLVAELARHLRSAPKVA
jgi:hypothetical protein